MLHLLRGVDIEASAPNSEGVFLDQVIKKDHLALEIVQVFVSILHVYFDATEHHSEARTIESHVEIVDAPGLGSLKFYDSIINLLGCCGVEVVVEPKPSHLGQGDSLSWTLGSGRQSQFYHDLGPAAYSDYLDRGGEDYLKH